MAVPPADEIAAFQLLGALGQTGTALQAVMHRHVENRLAITNRTVGILVALRLEGPKNPSELAQHLAMTPSDTSKALRKLDDEGLIERQPSVSDRRSHTVRLTEQGDALLTDVARTITNNIDDLQGLARQFQMLIARARARPEQTGSDRT